MRYLKWVFSIMFMVFVQCVCSKPLIIDDQASSVQFSVTHLMFLTAKGGFNTFNGTLHWNPEHLAQTVFEGTIDVDSIYTQLPKYNPMLLSEAYFNEEQFPTISFVSQQVERSSTHNYTVKGELTCKGKTLPIEEQLLVKQHLSPQGKPFWLFQTYFKINRMDYDIASHIKWPLVEDIVYVRLYFIAYEG